MQLPDFKDQYDVIVIGAGVGGLTGAALLSKAGLSVCVLEREPHPGGYLAGFRRKDFRFDTAIHWLNQYGPNGMVTTLFKVLGDDFPRAVVQDNIRRYKGPTFDYLLTSNPDVLKQQWQKEFPDDAQGIERFFAAAKKLGKSFANFGHIFRSEETMTLFEKMRNKGRLLKFALPFIPYIKYSGYAGVEKGLDKFFKSPGLREVFCSESELFSCLVPIGWAYFQDYQSPPKGGGQRIPEWLEHVAKSHGADIGYKCAVDVIDLENNTASGVTFTHRGKQRSIKSKYVIAACDVETLYEKMLPTTAIPESLKQKLRKAELYSSSVTLSIALDCRPDEIGFGPELIHLSKEGHVRGGDTVGDANLSEISILAPSTRDQSLAPAGCGTLTLFMPAHIEYENGWHTETNEKGDFRRGDAYKELKNRIAQIIIDRVAEKMSPNLREHILFIEVATPVTHWRYTGNKGGTMMGARPGRANMQAKVAHYRTPVKNLLLGGHWAELGGGVPIAVKAGANSSLLVLQKEKPEAFKLLASYMDGKVEVGAVHSNSVLKAAPNDWIPEMTPAEKAHARSLPAQE